VVSFSSKDYITFDGLTMSLANSDVFDANTCDNITVKNCTVELGYGRGILNTGTSGDNWVIESNVVRYNAGTGIETQANGNVNPTIRYNTVYGNAWLSSSVGDFQWTSGIKVFGAVGCLVEENKVYDSGFSGGDLSRGNGIWLDAVSDGVVQHNLVYDCYGSGIEIEIATDCDTLNNIVVRCGHNDYTAGLLAWATGTMSMTGCKFYGNVIYDSKYWGIASIPLDGLTYSNNVFKNNIIYKATLTAIRCDQGGINDADGTGNAYINNIFGPTSIPYFITWGSGNDYASVALWEAAVDDADVASDNLEGDPGMTDPDNLDCTIATGSQCIGAAVNLGASYDLGILPGSTWPDGVVTGDRDSY